MKKLISIHVTIFIISWKSWEIVFIRKKKTMFILPINFCVFPVSFQQYPFRGRITWPCVRSNVIITYAVVWRLISVMRSHIGQTNERLGLHLRKHYFLFDAPLWWGDLFCASGRYYTFGSSYFPGGGQQIVVKKTPQVSDSRTTECVPLLDGRTKATWGFYYWSFFVYRGRAARRGKAGCSLSPLVGVLHTQLTGRWMQKGESCACAGAFSQFAAVVGYLLPVAPRRPGGLALIFFGFSPFGQLTDLWCVFPPHLFSFFELC